MKRTLSLLLALIMVVGLMPDFPVFAADTSDDIYIDESSSLEELEDLGVVDYDEYDPWLDAPEEEEDPQPDIFVEDPKEPGEALEIPDDFSEYPEEPGEELPDPVEPDEWLEDHPEVPSPSDPFRDSPESDLSDRYASADADGQFQNGTDVGFGSLGGLVGGDMIQGNATVTKNLVWTANATGDNVCENLAIHTADGAPSFTDGGSYEIQIVPNGTDASADGATQLHINLYQLYINNSTTVRIYLDADAFEDCSHITEVVVHISSSAVNLIRVHGGSLTLEGLPGCKLVLDGKSLDGQTAFTASTERVLLQLGVGYGVDNVTVSHVTFRNAPRSAVYAYGGLMKSIRFANCNFESTCANSEAVGDSTSNRNGGAIRFAPYNSTTTPTLVEELTIDTCEFDGNTAMRYGGAVCLYGVFDQVEIKNSKFTNTSVSERTGGAIGIVGMFNKVDITGNTFTGCTAPGTDASNTSGGAIGVRAAVGKLTIDSDFSSCSTSQKGGAICVSFATLTSEILPHLTATVHTRINTLEISGSNFTDCSSGGRGGAICLDAQIGTVIIGKQGAANNFTNCKTESGKSGGGICFSSTQMTAEPNWPAEQWAPAGMTIESYAGGTPYDDYLTRSGEKYTAYRSVSVENCTFDGCQSSYGGGFYVPNNAKIETLVVKDVVAKYGVATSFTKEENGETTTAGGRGAGIALASFAPGCSITLDNVKAFNNRSDAEGGGVFIHCVTNTSINVIGCQYYNNTAGIGGGICIDGNDSANISISVSNSKIFKNTTVGNGGGVYLNNSIGNSTFTNVEVYGNLAGAREDASGKIIEKGTATCFGNGGGLYLTVKKTGKVTFVGGVIGAYRESTENEQGEAVVTLKRSPNRAFAYIEEVITPSATPDEPPKITFEANGGRGGGISVTGTGKSDASQLVMTDTQVCHNQSEYGGGGIFTGACNTRLNNVTLSDNQCAMVKDGKLVYDFREAIGLVGGGITASDSSTLVINGGVITRNKARDGGGLDIERGSTVTIQNVRLTYNEADRLGGGAFVGTTNGSLKNTLIATGCAFSYNEAGVGDGGGHGGGLAVYARSAATLTDTKFNNNKAYVGNVFTYNADGTKNYTFAENDEQNPDYRENRRDEEGNPVDEEGNPVYKQQYGTGGGVYGITATVDFYGVDVYDNESGRRGGGVYGESVSNFSIYNYPVEEGKTYLNEITTDQEGKQFIRSKIRSNVTRDYAGGIGSVGNLDRNVKCFLRLEGTLVEWNKVTRYGGGGVYISSLAECTITEGTVIQKNTAQLNAGGIYANIRATINVQGAEVIDNTANGNGGGMVISSDSEVVITAGSISNNTAAGHGGGVYASGSAEFGGCRVTIQSGLINNNTAGGNGGGVYAGGSGATNTEEASSTVTIEGGTVSGNRANGVVSNGGNGGGVYACKASTVTIKDGTITTNHAVRYGGGVAGGDYTKIVVTGGSIISNTAGSGGGVSVEDHTNIEVKNGRIAGNTARALWNENETKVSYGSGGGIFATGSGLIVVTGGDITENRAHGETYYTDDDQTAHSKTQEGPFQTRRNCGGYGGGIYAQGRMTVQIKLSENQTSGKITKNYASQNGGGIYAAGTYSNASNYGKVTVTIEGGQIGGLLEDGTDGGNTAGGSGGGIYVTGSNTKGKDSSASVTMSGGTISYNKANGTGSCGGGIATNSYSEVTFTGGTITNNSAYNGGGLYAVGYSSVKVNGGQISSNTAGHYGGGVYSSNDASVTLESGKIESNTAYYGGGIYANGTEEQSSTVTVNNGEICNNTALFGYGGGLFVIAGATLTVNNGKIHHNQATHTAVIDGVTVTEETGGYGGGIYATGYVSEGKSYGGGKVILEGGEIYNNEASKNGGGIYATGPSKYKNVAEASSVTINGGRIRNNTAAKEAGGIYANNCANVSISDGMIYENQAYNGGGLYAGTNSQVTVTGGEIKENVAHNGGGGIYASGYHGDGESLPCNVLINGGKISGNKANKTEVDGTWTDGSGGGICVASGAKVTVSNGEITSNTAMDGGGIYAGTSANVTITGGYIGAKLADSTDENGNPVKVVQKAGNTAAENGGGIYATNGASATVSDGIVAYNEAKLGGGLYAGITSQVTVTGGQIHSNSASEKGGGIYATNGVNATNETIAPNVQISGGKLYGNTAAENGGGIYATWCADVTVSNGEIYLNSAIAGGGIFANDNADVTVTGGLIYSNTATGSGGGINAANNSAISITGGYIGAKLVDSTDEEGNPVKAVQEAGNTATENGGGIYATLGAEVTVSNGSITYNEAVLGGGIYAGTQSNIEITGGQIYGNSASNNGGGIYATSTSDIDEDIASSVTVSGGKLYSNTATSFGGGIYATYCADVTVSDGEIYRNTAENGGGICANTNSDVSVTGGRIYSNSAGSNGGGLYAASNSNISITGGTIGGILEDGTTVGNTATENGGGIYAAGSATVTMRPKAGSGEDSGGVISNNSAYRGAGVYLTNTAKVTVSGGTIECNTAKVGGGIYAGSTSNVTVENGKIVNNTAVHVANTTSTGFGGGIYTVGSASLEISGGDIIRNAADSRGGGIHGQGNSSITVKGGEISDNKSKTSGGGISLTNNATITVQGGKISGNTANQDGGGIYIITASTATVEGGEISGNRAAGDGGGIYVGSTSGAAKVFIRKGTNEQGQVTVGTVRDNLADNGGGVFVLRGGTLIVNEGHIINNTAAAPKTADPLETGRKMKSTELHGAGGGICVVGENLKDGQGNQIIATFKLEGTLVNGKLNMAIYGNESTFSGDEVFSNGNHTSLDIPLVSQMNLDGYELDIVGWFEDYNTGDIQYTYGLNRKGLTSSAADRAQVKRYRNSTVTQRQIIADDYVNGSNLADGIQYVNLPNAYVAMALGIPNASNDTVVVDFGMSVDINLLSNDTLFNMDNPEGNSMVGTSLPDVVAADKEILYSKVGLAGFNINDYFLRDRTADDADTCIDLPMGKASWIQEGGKETGSLHYVLKNRQPDREEVFYYVVPGTNYYYYAAVTVVPATSIYYEDNSNLVTYHTTSRVEQLAEWGVVPENAQFGDPVQDQDRPGASILKDLDADNIYGYDSSYANCTTYSGGAAHWVTVTRDRNNPSKTTAARATFTFTGTGFDIVSLCSASTGILMVNVYEGADIDFDAPDFNRYVTTYMVDTHYGYAYNEQTGKWELNPASATTLYQVPVIKADLTKVLAYGDDPATQEEDPGYYYKDYGYGTYSVELYVANSFLEREPGYWSADFYLDAIRIYNPAGYNGGDNANIRDAYLDDQEGWPTYQELRNLFIEQTDLKDDEKVDGMIFIDSSDDPTIGQYKTWGPNNEIYLATGQTIAFRLDADSYTDQVTSVQIGMRGATGRGDVLVQCQGDGDDKPQTILDTQNGETGQLSATDLYYDISAAMGKVLTVKNTGSTPISLSNIKVTHSSDPANRSTGSGELGGYFSMSRHDAQIALNILTAQKLAEPTVTPKYPALSYNGMICYNVFFGAEDLGSLTAADLGLAVFDGYEPEWTVETARDVIMGATEIDGLYMVATNGVHAKYLGDTQYFRAFAKKADGSFVYSKMVSYSALDYATNVLAKSDDVKLKQLVVAMLNYGAEAQRFFGYKTDDLMNKALTADHQALLTGIDVSSLNSVGKVNPAKVGAFASTGGFTSKYPAISFKGAFEINYFFTPANAVDGDMTLYFWDEDTYNSVTELTAENADKAVVMTLENGTYTAASDEIIARQLDKTLYAAAVYESNGVTYCSGVLPYSIGAYCQKPPADVQALATAAAIYGCTAKQYFG